MIPLGILLLLTLLVGVPLAGAVLLWRLHERVRDLEDGTSRQRAAIDALERRLREVQRATGPTSAAAPARPPIAAALPPKPSATEPVKPPVAPPSAALKAPPAPPPHSPPPAIARPTTPAAPPPPPSTPFASSPSPRFDWEGLVGVKMFSAVAGIALVFAAVFFLRHSIDRGWLAPPIRVAIGTLVGVALLLVCELKAARRYAVTANALDAAAISILFSTFYAAHALWQLTSGGVTFGLLGLVTAVAVLLSIRRDSLFIAVLGLIGGFATPALLSTGGNRPISLFGYLLLLNLGLAWVAYRKRWPLVTILTLVFTALYSGAGSRGS